MTNEVTYRLISDKELKIRQNEVILTPQETSELLEYGDTFKKFLDKTIHTYQASMWECIHYRGREQEIYTAIDTILELKKQLTNLEVSYSLYQAEKEAEKAWLL